MKIRINISAPNKAGKYYVVERVTDAVSYTIKRFGENKADFTLIVTRKVTEEMLKGEKVQFALTNMRAIESKEVESKEKGISQVINISVELVEGFNKSRQKQLFEPRLKPLKPGKRGGK
jgi:predicted transcriptional regulator